MKKYQFTIEFMGKEIYTGEWEAEDIEGAREGILENLDLSITDDNPSIFKIEKGGEKCLTGVETLQE